MWFVDGDVVAASSSMTPEKSLVSTTILRLRLEDERAVNGLGLTERAWRNFQRSLIDRLTDCVTVNPNPIELQREVDRRSTISLDPMNRGTVDIGVSRLFDCGGTRHLGYVARPGWPSLEEQMASVRPGRWTIIEDDRMTGGTIRFVRERLPSGVEIVEEVLGMEEGISGEIADSRDFLLGSACGGLVVSLPDGTVAHTPYLLPYVDPFARCGLRATEVVCFSRDVWALNAAAFDGSNLRVADLDEAHRSVLLIAGHGANDELAYVCRRHEETLDSLIC